MKLGFVMNPSLIFIIGLLERPYEIVFKESSRILKNGASMIVFMSILRVETLVEIANGFVFYYKTTGIWHKTNPMPRNMNLHFVNSKSRIFSKREKKNNG